jgi:geranylgeranyl diphosphate synthase type II
VDRALDRLLPPADLAPRPIHESMRYTTLAEGKRLRPAMVLLAYETCGGAGRAAEPVAAALEMVHAFSLIHDDLPAMDDDAFRRGRPANHIRFGEGVAILAGNALLSLAFQTLGRLSRPGSLGPAVASRLVEELAEATGTSGVIGGQVLDLLSEGQPVPRATVDYIHRHKTARLMMAALRLGALTAEAPPRTLRLLTGYGECVGTAFQIVDDILSHAGTFQELGREPGRDVARGKATYPGVVGMKGSHGTVDRLLRRAEESALRLPAHRDLYRGLAAVVDLRRRDAAGRRLGVGEGA